jgi:hydroxypyruvate reductase
MLRRSYMQTGPPDLRYDDHVRHIHDLIGVAMKAADPARALAANWPLALEQAQRCHVVGAGKAALEMALKLQELCGDRLAGGVVAVVPQRLELLQRDPAARTLRFQALPVSHPLPDERGIRAAQAIAAVAQGAGSGEHLIALVSGGGSAMLTLPAGSLTLADLRTVTDALQKAGAPITDLNTVRKHCEQLKGGGLARLAYPAEVWAFILSDVVGDSLSVIASGPTAPDPTTYADALGVLRRYGLQDAVPAVAAHLEAGARSQHPETVKPGDPVMASVTNLLIGSNRLALEAARRHAIEQGWRVVGFEFGVEGEARLVGMQLALRVRDILQRSDRPACYLLGGETTVTVHGAGRGGRNQELALAAAITLDGVEGVAVASFATDGVDGQSEAAGAIVTGQTCARARALGLDPEAYLNNNDSNTFFKQVGGLIELGPTGTNVNDIAIALVY